MTTMMTAEQRIAAALNEGVKFTVDHETKRFVGFRFRLSTEARDTVVRIHRDTALFAALTK